MQTLRVAKNKHCEHPASLVEDRILGTKESRHNGKTYRNFIHKYICAKCGDALKPFLFKNNNEMLVEPDDEA